jgi:hypothetical protein
MLRTLTSGVAVVVLFAAAPNADAATRYVADTGSDGPSCGISLATACRSISQAVELANPGDTILVGPGRYGDLNRNGVLGEPGEELGYLTPPASCSCVLRIEKRVIIMSSGGAAVTMIDGRTVDVIQNVFLTTVGGEFGRPGKGFTVTGTKVRHGQGIVLDAGEVWLVRGHQVIFTGFSNSTGKGISTVNNVAIRIEGNQVTGWYIGIEGRGAATVSKNQVWGNGYGIVAAGGSVVGNVVTANLGGMLVTGTAQVLSNAVYANGPADDYGIGIRVDRPFSGAVKRNNLVGNTFGGLDCGLWNAGVIGLDATNNYWGVPTGPGAPPADSVCNIDGGTTTTSPMATKPFTVKPLKP